MNTAPLLVLLLAEAALVQSADFKGAAEVLRQAAQASPKPQAKNKDPHKLFRDKLKVFQTQSTNLAPALAAQQWLGLLEDFEKESGEGPGSPRGGPRAVKPLQFDEVMLLLPPPGAWVELEKLVESRSPAQAKAGVKRELGLRLIVHTLTKNTVRRTEDLKALDVLAKQGGGPEAGYEFNSIFTALNEAILATMDDPEAILRLLESQLNERR